MDEKIVIEPDDDDPENHEKNNHDDHDKKNGNDSLDDEIPEENDLNNDYNPVEFDPNSEEPDEDEIELTNEEAPDQHANTEADAAENNDQDDKTAEPVITDQKKPVAPEPLPKTPEEKQPSKSKAAISLIRENLKKGSIPDSVKMVMAQGTLPSGDDVPLDIMILLACDKNEEVKSKARLFLLGFSEEKLFQPLYEEKPDANLVQALINFFSKDENKIRSMFFNPRISMDAKKACIIEMPHIFSHYLAREIQRLPSGWVIFDFIQKSEEHKHLLIDKLLEIEQAPSSKDYSAKELTETQKVLLRSFNPILVTKNAKMVFAKGKTPSGEQLPAEIILQLIIDNDQEVRSEAALTLMDYNDYEIAEALGSDRMNKMILKALAHYSPSPIVMQAILKSSHITDGTVNFLIEKDFSGAIEGFFLQLIANEKFQIFRKVLREYPECANYVVSQFYKPTSTKLDIEEWIEKSRLERQVSQLGLELESIEEMEQHTFSLGQLFQYLPPENVAKIGDIIHGKASGGQTEYDRLFLSLLDIDLLREVMGDEQFKQVVANLKAMKSTALLKSWAVLVPHHGISGKVASLIYAFWSLGKAFALAKNMPNVYITVVELFQFVMSLLKVAMSTPPTFSFFDLKTMFLGSRSIRFTPEDEEQVTQQLLKFGFRCQSNGNFQLDMTQFFSNEEIERLVKGEATKEAERELTNEEIEKVKKEIKNLSPAQRATLAKQAPVEVLRMLLNDPDAEVVLAALNSDKITQREALIVALNKTASPKALKIVAEHKEWIAKYPVKIALVNNPHTPSEITVELVPDLLQQDLIRLIQGSGISSNVRALAVKLLKERISDLSTQERIQFAEKASLELVEIFMDDKSDQVQAALLKSPGIKEGHIVTFIKRKFTSGLVLDAIADSPTWTSSYQVLLGLVNHQNLPKPTAIKLMKSLSKYDLKFVYQNKDLAKAVQDQARMLYMQKGG